MNRELTVGKTGTGGIVTGGIVTGGIVTGGIVAALALATGRARASAAVPTAKAASGFR
jgi:hypothetical protein